MMEILFIRHGQTDYNAGQRVMGAMPIPLNEKGINQARQLADYLKGIKFDAVVTSPVKRAVQTAEILINGREILLLEDERFSEIEYGEWVDLTYSDLVTKYADSWRDYHQKPETFIIPGGERLSDVCKRTKAAVNDLMSKYPEGRVAIISHADVIKLAIISILNWPISLFQTLSMDNCATILLRRYPVIGLRQIWFNLADGFARDIKTSV